MVNHDIVGDGEKLYRVIKRSRPDCLSDSGCISQALFKDIDGISVDRDGGRIEDEIIDFILNITFKRRTRGICMVTSDYCMKIGADVIPEPSDINPFHANIWLDSQNENNRNLQALKLADACKLIYSNDNIG